QALPVTENGWLGFTDKYWMTTLIAPQGQAFDAVYKAIPGAGAAGRVEYRTEMRLPVMTVEPGATSEVTTSLFAGAKELNTITGYEDDLGIVNFVDAIDWGWFYFLTKPFARLLVGIQDISVSTMIEKPILPIMPCTQMRSEAMGLVRK
ncbi:MAG: membrane protein insertase YidC, partial [Pseudomonadota bacterium]